MTLQEIYKDLFRIGVACERIHGPFTRHEIGNPEKEALMREQFNSMTFGNELKPMYNCGIETPNPFNGRTEIEILNPGITEDKIPFMINPSAKAMLDWAKENGMPVRGHVLVWHSQCPKEFFCKGYKPVTQPVDPELLKKNPMMAHFAPLEPSCLVDRDTMLSRMESYIDSALEYMYANGYGNVIYAWDVVNEAIELADKTPTGLRNSYWYQTIGDDFIYWAFRFAKNAVVRYSAQYAALYGVDAGDEAAVKGLQFKLFYNDYNEWMPDKQDAIIAALQREGENHGSIIGEGLIDGIGMQGHLSDNNDVDEYGRALRKYAALVEEIHVTELDVKCTCTNANAEYYQAVFYKKWFEELLAAKKEGCNITCVTFWGLTDDNSWIRDADPLLFHGDLTTKKSYDAVVYAVTGEDLGEPLEIHRDLSDRYFDFEPDDGETAIDPIVYGMKMRGFGQMAVKKGTSHSGSWAIVDERRFGDWCGISMDVSDFIGQTIHFSAWVKTAAKAVVLNTDFGGKIAPALRAEAGNNEWTELSGEIQIPANLHAAVFVFHVEDEAGNMNEMVLDDIRITLIGQLESFEGDTHIASIRGAGHLPFISVTDKESLDGRGHSLQVVRQEKDATVKFDVSAYIGLTVSVSAWVKTTDKVIKLGLNGSPSAEYATVPAASGEWTQITAEANLPEDLVSAELYLETDGNAEFFVDDIWVKRA